MLQKFKMHSFVHVGTNMPPEMEHFEKDFDAIVGGSFSQIHGGKDVSKYALYKLENGIIVDLIAWYKEEQLTEIDSIGDPQEMIETFNFLENNDNS